jgi:hypothetical protein
VLWLVVAALAVGFIAGRHVFPARRGAAKADLDAMSVAFLAEAQRIEGDGA